MKIGRNDPCHCGSNRKYKKCCAAKDEAEQINLTDLAAHSGGETSPVANEAHTRGAPPVANKPSSAKRPPPRPTVVRKHAV